MIPDLTTLWIVLILFLCTILLNTLVFKPILRVIDQRAGSVREARELAESASRKASEALADYDRTLQAARAEVYGQMDDTRRISLEKRTVLLAATRATLEEELSAATTRVRQESADARASLEADASSLAGAIVARVLGRAS